jgi:hypothetical protein
VPAELGVPVGLDGFALEMLIREGEGLLRRQLRRVLPSADQRGDQPAEGETAY